jgi:HK97 gp10 family phage protein
VGRAKITVTVKGLDELKAKLDALPGQMLAGAERAVADETEEVAQDMRDGAPYRTGELRESINAEHEGLEGRAVATAPYATVVEFGTSSQPSQPFAQPAAERSRSRFPGRIADAVREELPR